MKIMNNLKGIQLSIIKNFAWFVVIIMFLIFGLFRSSFLHSRTISYMLYVSSLTGFLIFAQSLCLISGNFDLSIARIAGISVLVGGLLITRWFPGAPGILGVIFVLVFGALLGALLAIFHS